MKSRGQMIKILFDLYCEAYKKWETAKSLSDRNYFSGKANGIADVLEVLFHVHVQYDEFMQKNVMVNSNLGEEKQICSRK